LKSIQYQVENVSAIQAGGTTSKCFKKLDTVVLVSFPAPRNLIACNYQERLLVNNEDSRCISTCGNAV